MKKFGPITRRIDEIYKIIPKNKITNRLDNINFSISD